MLKRLKGLIVSCISLILLISCASLTSSCDDHYPPPKIKDCVHIGLSGIWCVETDESERLYEHTESHGFKCTDPRGYERLYNYTDDLRKKLIQCENSCD